ncbi:hypothetical protein [Natronoglomus mannanivorans]|uniref:Uncharacterized protein n=1 Tax=Natronoglomus mannanivorans TaxID=2979990 RepID=A0AAP3E4K4_9EURY|nr:hypothetical protein [Halobacteria archaeon AArc-xg1-1]
MTRTLEKPRTSLTGAQKNAFEHVINTLTAHRDRRYWGEKDNKITYDDPNETGRVNETQRITIEILPVHDLKDGDTIRTVTGGHFILEPEEIVGMNNDNTIFTTQSGAASSKYELVDEAWHRTEFAKDTGWLQQNYDQERKPIDAVEVAVVRISDSNPFEFNTGDFHIEYQ